MDHGQYFSQVHNHNQSDRLPQWSNQETQDFLVIRAGLDPNFTEIKRNKLLWEMVSARMKEIGYDRTPLQCKSKWKNLITRYKGCETIQELEMRQQAFPFYNEMKIIFNARMQRMMWVEAEGGSGSGAATSSQNKSPSAVQVPSNDDEEEKGHARKRRKEKESSSVVDGVKGIMEEFMRQQVEIEMQWMKAYEEREERRREREMEWRQRMEALENERLMMMRWWREREEERKIREEGRAERRDALVTALLNKLRRQGM